MDTKICRRCDRELPESDFITRSDNGRPISYCLPCRNDLSRESNKRLSRGGLRKKCSECKQWLQVDDFETGGRQPSARCTSCLFAAIMDGRARKGLIVEGRKLCLRCMEFFPLKNFPPNDRGLGGVGSYCLPCQRAYHQDRYKAKADAYKASSYRWRRENREVYLAQHRLHQFKRRWAEEAQADGTLTEEWLKEIYGRRTCYYCGTIVQRKDRTLEHKIPLSLGGVHGISNVEMACKKCNSSKRDLSEENYKERLQHAGNNP